jgi:hypothetical protein
MNEGCKNRGTTSEVVLSRWGWCVVCLCVCTLSPIFFFFFFFEAQMGDRDLFCLVAWIQFLNGLSVTANKVIAEHSSN